MQDRYTLKKNEKRKKYLDWCIERQRMPERILENWNFKFTYEEMKDIIVKEYFDNVKLEISQVYDDYLVKVFNEPRYNESFVYESGYPLAFYFYHNTYGYIMKFDTREGSLAVDDKLCKFVKNRFSLKSKEVSCIIKMIVEDHFDMTLIDAFDIKGDRLSIVSALGRGKVETKIKPIKFESEMELINMSVYYHFPL